MIRYFTIWTVAVLLSALVSAQGQAVGQTQELSALARLVGEGVTLDDTRRGMTLDLGLSQPVPWRVFTLDAPPRLVLDFSELDWTGLDPAGLLAGSDRVESLNHGLYRPGWTRLVLELAEPLAVEQAGMRADATGAHVKIVLGKTDAEAFALAAGAPASALFAGELGAETFEAKARQTGDQPLVVVLDPGHGGIDPGAERDEVIEAELMLQFARELKETLLRTEGFEVVLTRDDDRFVPLETRVSIARQAGADVFLSLHADALAQGRATGASVYTLSAEASDLASQKLAERHDRADLLAGVDLSQHDDAVALVLMDMARVETAPRSARLADALVEGIHSATGSTHKTPRLEAGFSVLKAPDIPSVLIELGFLSSEQDRKNLVSQTWRTRAAEGIRDALLYWAIEDAAEAVRLRQ
nr:N-acetylmuramoyl-L-alanine amidase [Aliiroseovarius subalbicans]